jgi:hypothetical protein
VDERAARLDDEHRRWAGLQFVQQRWHRRGRRFRRLIRVDER